MPCAAVVLKADVCHGACGGAGERIGVEVVRTGDGHVESTLAVALHLLYPTVAVEQFRPVAIRTAIPHGERVEARRPEQGFQSATDHTWLISVDAGREQRRAESLRSH